MNLNRLCRGVQQIQSERWTRSYADIGLKSLCLLLAPDREPARQWRCLQTTTATNKQSYMTILTFCKQPQQQTNKQTYMTVLTFCKQPQQQTNKQTNIYDRTDVLQSTTATNKQTNIYDRTDLLQSTTATNKQTYMTVMTFEKIVAILLTWN